ncbi:hypothetical protein CWB99_19980 [Pseudoalteromonas rubra]|uniref:HEAT repeat domain-containing protein n=1 Tax=Pseudoalteromonas rubra TaxID=43658 RepID=A0A5S3WHK5_9GAMM|nr:HEAT repeat domain-containing protein [Pseudoalteromonas rubra]TMP25896.1 hypothetical protein CWB99_19980 [Pseudoalteromonas rubra]TMP29848.1 hypothetical protein CWC00_18490 [Pseudoalteromonas rubra]
MFFYHSYRESPLLKLLSIEAGESEFISDELKRIIDAGELSWVVNRLLSIVSNGESMHCISVDGFNMSASNLELRLARSLLSACTLKIIEGSPHQNRDVFFLYPNDVTMFFYGHGVCEAILYEYEEMNDYEIFDVNRRLVKKERLTFKNGDLINIKAGDSGLQILNVNDIFIFEVSSFKHHNIVHNFHVETGAMLYPSSADVSSTRLTTTLEVLKTLGDRDSVKYMSDIAKNHRQHFVRWKAIEAIACLDEEYAKNILIESLNDSHPEVRAAAKKTLEFNGVV